MYSNSRLSKPIKVSLINVVDNDLRNERVLGGNVISIELTRVKTYEGFFLSTSNGGFTNQINFVPLVCHGIEI